MLTTEKILQTMSSWHWGELIFEGSKQGLGRSSRSTLHWNVTSPWGYPWCGPLWRPWRRRAGGAGRTSGSPGAGRSCARPPWSSPRRRPGRGQLLWQDIVIYWGAAWCSSMWIVETASRPTVTRRLVRYSFEAHQNKIKMYDASNFHQSYQTQ